MKGLTMKKAVKHVTSNSILLGVILHSTAVLAQPTEEWVARYDNNGTHGRHGASAIAVDSSGNSYVIGTSTGTGTSSDFATVKYDADGVQLWEARHGTSAYDYGRHLVLDNNDNVYVAGIVRGSGSPYNDYGIVKYDTNGNTLWETSYNGPSGMGDSVAGIAVDSNGNVYVTGTSDYHKGSSNYATVKYNSNGNLLWEVVSNSGGMGILSNNWDYATGIAVDGNNNVYVLGSSQNGGGYAYVVIKYDTNGTLLWANKYNGPGGGWDYPNDLVVDGADNVYVTGKSPDAAGLNDYATVKFDSNGNLLWASRYNGPQNQDDEATSIAIDGSGNVFVTGESNNNYATVKYDSNGMQQWVNRYSGHPTDSTDAASDIAVDGSGNVYVTGSSKWGSVYTGGTGYDYVTVKYDTNGNEQWLIRSDFGLAPYSRDDTSASLALDMTGNIYVTGSSDGLGLYNLPDYATVKYSIANTALGPDLTPTALTLSATSVLTGSTITLNDTFINQGTDPVSQNGYKQVRYYLSTDQIIDTADTSLGIRAFYGVAVGGENSGTREVTIPPALSAGTYYVGVVVDYTDAVDETNESNNTLIASTALNISVDPNLIVGIDLTPTTLTLSATSAAPGSTITLNDTFINQGTDPVSQIGYKQVRYYLSTDQIIDTADTSLGIRAFYGVVGGENSGTREVTIPPALSAGTYYVGVVVDYTDAVDETNEENNAMVANDLFEVLP